MRTLKHRIEAFISDARNFTAAQREIIRAPDRVVVVRACPGAGKTRVFATRFAKEVAEWSGRTGGVAALSFTNVAQREVQRRVVELGAPGCYPHFIGTIDAFLLRFVLKPFAERLVNLARFTQPHEVGEYGLQMVQLKASDAPEDLRRLSEFVINPRTTGGVDVSVSRRGRGWVSVPKDLAKTIVEAKKEVWLSRGELTYPDVCAVAWKLLRDDTIRDIVSARFSVVLVDEFQDTTGVRASCLLRLLESQHCQRALLVGDPDQCIMEFAGADPRVFEQFEGLPDAKPLRLVESFRAHEGITSIAALLRRTSGGIASAVARSAGSEALLLVHDHGPRPKAISDVPLAFARRLSEAGASPARAVILAWSDADVRRLAGGGALGCPYQSHAVRRIVDAIAARKNGDIRMGAETLQGVVCVLAFEQRTPTRRTLEAVGLTPRQWRARLLSLLASLEPEGTETIEAWFHRVRALLEVAVGDLIGKPEKLGHKLAARVVPGRSPALTAEAGQMFQMFARRTTDISLRVRRVHQVKGEEFESVCFFVPRPAKADLGACATLLGEPLSAEADEARRVSFVAISRAIRHLMVVIPAPWVHELHATEPGRAFLAAFDNAEPMAVSAAATDPSPSP